MISKTEIWAKLHNHKSNIASKHLKQFFTESNDRFKNFSIETDGILFDFSKNYITNETLQLLYQLADEVGLKEKINLMFEGEKLNFTENRAVLHTALRNFSDEPVFCDGQDVMPQVRKVLQQIKEFCNKVHSGQWVGFTGKRITDVVNIGIGGSDLGPKMVCNALRAFAKKNINIYFVSNVDANHIMETLRYLNPETTLFIIASKTFTTQETLTNAFTAKNWLLNSLKNDSSISRHFVALSTNEKAVVKFGIDKENMFEFWDWVGGRFSLWSAIGLSIALYLGYDNFERLLKGAWWMDSHFRFNDYSKNIPILLALIGIWYNNFFNAKSYAIIPYDQYLSLFPEYLQQLEMESNGKSVNIEGEFVDYTTCPIIWGSPGTNAQHSFFQLLHQGTHFIPVDFIAFVEPLHPIGNHHQILLSNLFAQAEALMNGNNENEVLQELNIQKVNNYSEKILVNNKIFPGGKPSNVILFEKLTPENLGKLIALYEHKVFVQGIIWQLNSFDQWGVELGKKLAKNILNEIENDNVINPHDSSTKALINFYKLKVKQRKV